VSADTLRRGAVAGAIRRHRLVVVLRRIEPYDALRRLVEELADAGARVFEITFDAPSAADDLRRLREQLGADALVGAGTIRSGLQLAAARDAGADFAVAPLLDLDLVGRSVDEGMPFVPGAMTPTEIASAWAAGATFVKLFPASAVGAGFVRELRGPMPEVELIPTGGVDRDLARELLGAGAAAVGIGGALVRAGSAERRAIVEEVSS
jgi:2-dehydro-3-deoxyphosphogluconate aldolase / (4S)-4-hydroxy-2-oxoglutarate aldolase